MNVYTVYNLDELSYLTDYTADQLRSTENQYYQLMLV